MATPTITSVSPSTVWTGGQMVTVVGTNFRTATIPTGPASGPLPAPNPTMQVSAGGVAAKNVRVLSTTQLTCFLGAHDLGLVSLLVQNLDDAGVAIPGESATRANALTYARPDLAARGDYDRLNRAIIRLLKQQILENVTQSANADWGDEPFEVAAIGDVPALVLSQPAPQWATAVYQGRQLVDVGAYPATSFERRRRPVKVDIRYQLQIITNTTGHMTALQPLVMQFFDRTGKLTIDRDPADPTKGTIEFPMFIPFTEAIGATGQPNNSNIHSASVSFVVQGFGIEDIAGFPGESVRETGGIIDTINVNATAKV